MVSLGVDFSSSNIQRTGRRCDRTFTGCWTCRARKVKCDEAAPACTPCLKADRKCAGYESKLVWVTDDKTYKSHQRRFLRCDLTWADVPILDSDQIDYFVSLCDASEHVLGSSIEWSPEAHIPFSVFPQFVAKIPTSLSYDHPLQDEEGFLFRHYVNHVAFLMMPYDDARNPWRSSYPATALHRESNEQNVLYRALLAHAAVNLAHLGCAREKLLLTGARYYTSALKELQECILSRQNDYAPLIAAIMTLMFVEVYSGHSRTWRTHFDGAWKVFLDQRDDTPWSLSDFAWSSTQSLCIIKIISDTSKFSETLTNSPEFESSDEIPETDLSSISSEPSFGFTIGATQHLMSCISDIRMLSRGIRLGKTVDDLDDRVASLYTRLEECRRMDLDDGFNAGLVIDDVPLPVQSSLKASKVAQYHFNAFLAATYIYLYQSIFELPPRNLRPYVKEVFENIREFFDLGGGNFSLWPAYIAAVEAYTDEDISAARSWLDTATKVGMGNRVKIKAVVERVWSIRQETSKRSGLDQGEIHVDWRKVMFDLDMDVLLV